MVQSNTPALASRSLFPLAKAPDYGVRKLASAMLIQALRDLYGKDVLWREDARQWLASSEVDPGRFSWVCSILGISPGVLRRRLAETPHGLGGLERASTRGGQRKSPEDLQSS